MLILLYLISHQTLKNGLPAFSFTGLVLSFDNLWDFFVCNTLSITSSVRLHPTSIKHSFWYKKFLREKFVTNDQHNDTFIRIRYFKSAWHQTYARHEESCTLAVKLSSLFIRRRKTHDMKIKEVHTFWCSCLIQNINAGSCMKYKSCFSFRWHLIAIETLLRKQ